MTDPGELIPAWSPIDPCLSLFDWAPFRSTTAAVKLYTLLDLRGSIPAFIDIIDGNAPQCIFCKNH